MHFIFLHSSQKFFLAVLIKYYWLELMKVIIYFSLSVMPACWTHFRLYNSPNVLFSVFYPYTVFIWVYSWLTESPRKRLKYRFSSFQVLTSRLIIQTEFKRVCIMFLFRIIFCLLRLLHLRWQKVVLSFKIFFCGFTEDFLQWHTLQ